MRCMVGSQSVMKCLTEMLNFALLLMWQSLSSIETLVHCLV